MILRTVKDFSNSDFQNLPLDPIVRKYVRYQIVTWFYDFVITCWIVQLPTYNNIINVRLNCLRGYSTGCQTSLLSVSETSKEIPVKFSFGTSEKNFTDVICTFVIEIQFNGAVRYGTCGYGTYEPVIFVWIEGMDWI